MASTQTSDRTRRGVIRDALGIAIASGAYAVSFGAISTAAGLSLLHTCALSVLMFTGASQFALVGVVGAGGSVWAGAAVRAGALGVAVVAVLLRAPFLVVVVSAAATAALLRLF